MLENKPIPLNPPKLGLTRDVVISYDTAKKQYYVQSINPETEEVDENFSEITPPCDIVSYYEKGKFAWEQEPQEEISIIDTNKGMIAYSREIKKEGSTKRFSPEQKGKWATASISHIPKTAFSWHNERNKEFVWSMETGARTSPNFIDGSPLTNIQKKIIEETFLIQNINAFKQSCTSLAEYTQGLEALIEGRATKFLLDATYDNFASLQERLTFASLLRLPLNTRNAIGRENHLATVDEAKQYVQRVLQKALSTVDDKYNKPMLPLEGKEGNRLSPYDDDSAISILNAAKREEHQTLEKTHPPGSELSRDLLYLFRTIAKVQESQTTQVRDDALLEDLKEADSVLTRLLTHLGSEMLTSAAHPYYKDIFTKYVAVYLNCLMSGDLAQQSGPSYSYQKVFLIPLQKNIQAKIKRLQEEAARRPAREFSPEGIEVPNKDLLNPGMRTRLREWFENKQLPPLTHNESTKTLSGALFNDKDINLAIHSNKLTVHKAQGELTDDELRESTHEIIRILGDIFGEVPPLRPLGTPAQKAVILEVLKTTGVTIIPEPATDSPDENQRSPEAGFMRPY